MTRSADKIEVSDHLSPGGTVFRLILTTSLMLLFWGCNSDKNVVVVAAQNSPGGISGSTPIRWTVTAVTATGLDVVIGDDIVNSFAGGDLDGSGDDPIEQMMKDWNGSMGNATFFRVPATTTTNKDHANLLDYFDLNASPVGQEMGVYNSAGWFSDVSSSALAITQFFGERKNVGLATEYLELVHADIIFNLRDFTFSTNAGSGVDYDLHSVILHELGHFIGLDHQVLGASAVMAPTLGISDSQRSLLALDVTSITALYNGPITSALSSEEQIFFHQSTLNGGPTNRSECLSRSHRTKRFWRMYSLF